MNIRTDLAVEAASMLQGSVLGIETHTSEENGIKVERVRVVTDEAAEQIGKPKGSYVTITTGDLSENEKERYEDICICVAEEIKNIINIGKNSPVLTVGLGNERITADSIGPKCIQNLLVTRHIKKMMPEEIDERVREVSAITPSVMALTGIETGDIVKGVTEKVSPDLVIVIDALAARSMTRLGRTIQITDTGINPGSGVGNNRKELSEKTLGVRVVAIGVPMVVDARTVAVDCMEIAVGEDKERLLEIYEKMEPGNSEMVVTSKDVDSLSDQSAKIIANGINLALQPMGREDIDRYN